MTPRHVLFLVFAIIVMVFTLTVLWEFAVESMVHMFLTGEAETQSAGEAWEYVITSIVAVTIAMLLASPLVLRLIKERDESIEAKFAQALQIEQEKSNFVDSLSHEMRTPLNGILGFSDLMIRQETDPTKKSRLNLIRHSGQTLLSLINDLLDLSKIESGNFRIESEEFSPHELLARVEAFWSTLISENVTFQVELDPSVPERIQGDAVRIEQILQNLVSNAAKFTECGHIRISLCGELGHSGYILKGRVEDTGPGMTEAFMDKIFDRFTQQDETSQSNHVGSGLGLAISKSLANLMDGDITVDSALGRGSTFSFSVVTQIKAQSPDIQLSA